MKIINMNKDWKFSLDEPSAPHLLDTVEEGYRTVDIPHDWSVELPFDEENGEGCTAFLPGGFGWYRKHFETSQEMQGKRIFISFDGIYNNASIYINGRFVEMHPYGYSPFFYDITDDLNPVGEDNLLAVSVDRRRYADSRWYTGSGIYRDVTLHIANPVHIPMWGVFAYTQGISEDKADIRIETKIDNTEAKEQKVVVRTTLSRNSQQSMVESEMLIAAGQTEMLLQDLEVEAPVRWDVENPYLYDLHVEVIVDGTVQDVHGTKYGIRDFRFDLDKGFFLNGKNMLIKGVCLHHDCGAVGAAVPDDVWIRRLEKLKDCGCNALRISHNPASKALLRLCDEMGFLVQEEFFDQWDNGKDKRSNGTEQKVDFRARGYEDHFQKWAKKDLQNTMLRDRNHPCIFQWSIGNEIEWTYRRYNLATGYFGADASGNYFWTPPPYDIETIRHNIAMLPEERYEIGKTAMKLSKWTKEMDTTRPVIANCIFPSASYESGYTDALDIVGYSYRRIMYNYGHENYPEKPIMGTENLGQWHEWKAVIDREFIPGIFVWTGMDYMGEAGNPPKWPVKGQPTGFLDIAGFPKHSYYMYKSLWQDEPVIHIATQVLEKSLYKLSPENELQEKEEDGWQTRVWYWQEVNSHWNYTDGDDMVIEIYSNCDSITLYCGDTCLGEKKLADFEDHIYKWHTKFTPGVLKAVGTKDGNKATQELHTTQPASKLHLTADKDTLSVSKNGAAHLSLQLQDESSRDVKWEELEIHFDVTGACKVLGVDNGAIDSVQPYKSTSVKTHIGRCLLMIQADEPGDVKIVARADGMASDTINISIVP